MDSFYLQWHITNSCNLRCSHCYQSDYSSKEEFNFIELVQAFIQYKEFIDFLNTKKPSQELIRPTMAITGGEPFARGDFIDLLEIISAHKDVLDLYILTNGTLIDKNKAKKIKEYGVSKVQVSIEGDEKTHDEIRGAGSFRKAIRGIEHLVNNDISVAISFTAHKQNYKIFPKVVEIAKNVGASRIGTDRIVPEGSGKNLLMLSKEETKEYIYMIENQIQLLSSANDSNLQILNHRALQFLATSDEKNLYKCSIGKNSLTLLPNGDVYVCRRLPIVIGNIKEQSLREIYFNSKIMKQLRKPSKAPVGCEKCKHNKVCNGGAKCISYAIHNSLDFADPGCWLVNK